MRILEINKFNFPKRGADRHFVDVCELLKSAGHEVAIFSMHHPNNLPSIWDKYFLSEVDYSDGRYTWKKIKGALRMFFSWEAWNKINSILDDFRPDIVHVHNVYHQLSPTILFAVKRRGIPIVMTVHDFAIISPNHALWLDGKSYTRCKGGKFYRCFLDRAWKKSYAKSALAAAQQYWHEWLGTYRKNIDLYIAPSEFVRSTLVDWGVDSQKIVVLPHFISQLPTENDEKVQRGENFALYAGQLSVEKGTDALLRIFEKSGSMKIKLAGSCEQEFRVKNTNNIEYLGFMAKSILQREINKAACVVSGSRLPETFGLVALEAIAAGKPFVGFRTGAFGEIITNGMNGWLVETEKEFIDVIRRISSGEIVFDSDAIQKDAVRRFGKENHAISIEKLFHTATSKKGEEQDGKG